MLSNLLIKNFAIIKNISLNFNLGFNVLIGETGAGKSIILDALNFALGDKANKESIRAGENEMFVKATFENLSFAIKNLMSEFDIDCEEGILIISRTYNIDGKSICKINGQTITLTMLKQIAQFLVDAFGQHDGVMMLKTSNHIKLLDDNCHDELLGVKKDIETSLNNLNEINLKIEKIGGDSQLRDRKIDLLSYQINEIENANLKENEEDDLKNQLQIANNFESLNESLVLVLNNLKTSKISDSLAPMSVATRLDESLNELNERLNSANIELDDIASSISGYLSNINFDEKDIDNLNIRLDLIKSLKKKYGNSYIEIINFLTQAKQELENLQNSEELLIKLNKEKSLCYDNLYKLSITLHNIRVKYAKQIEKKVQSELRDLGMKNAVFIVDFKELPLLENAKFTKNGLDNVEFLFSANAGEAPKSLSKIISGGELSRFMLAVKNVINENDKVSTLVFDEVDAGISGSVAAMVAQRIAKLSKNYQVLCITHLQPVTAMADNFIFVEKNVVNGFTESSANNIQGQKVIEYIANLSGQGLTNAALENAKDLLEWAKNCKNECV